VSLLTKAQMREFIAANDFHSPEDIQRALKALLAETLQTMLDAELDTHLGYPKHAPGPKPTANRRNGRYPKTVTSEYGEVTLAVPRDRAGSFAPAVVPPHQTTLGGIEDPVVARYARGMSTRDIQAQLADRYGVAIAPALVSHSTDQLLPRITEGQQLLPGGVPGRDSLQRARGRARGHQGRLYGGGH